MTTTREPGERHRKAAQRLLDNYRANVPAEAERWAHILAEHFPEPSVEPPAGEGRAGQLHELRVLCMEFGWDSCGPPALWLRRRLEYLQSEVSAGRSALRREALDRARATMIRALDALESDADIDARREAFEMIQEEFEGVSLEDHDRAKALIPTLQAAVRALDGGGQDGV